MNASSKDKPGMVTGLFYDRDSAERAYQAISDRGYDTNDLNLLMSDETRRKLFPGDTSDGPTTELGNKAAEGAGIGGAVGGTMGATLGALIVAGTSIVLPGLGLVIAGPLAAAAAGAATGGLIGALIGWGMPEEHVRRYESGLKEGGILMGVKPRSEEDALHVEEQWRRHSGQQIYR
jgi:hypothetical protein